MDDENLEDLKNQAETDNSKLEEIMKKEITPESQREFLEVFKDSRLLMPVTFSENVFEGIENAKEGDIFQPDGQVGFDINYLTDAEGRRAVPLFTSSEMMEKAGLRSSVYGLYMSDLADMLKQTDNYSVIAVNPFTEHDINMPIQAFLSLFEEPADEEREFLESLERVLKILKEHSVELEDDYSFFIRADENFMVENAVDGVFIPNIPFQVSSRSDYGEGMKYTNILLMPKSKRILPIGPVENGLDIFIAPGSEFKIEKRLDEFTTVWKCTAQPFYDEL